MRILLIFLACLHFTAANATKSTALSKDQSPVLETKYFRFYNNINLNTHLYLYRKAVRCKFKKTPADSIAIVGSENSDMPLTEVEMDLVKKTILYYRDSLIGKDLLFDPEMSGFSDILVKDNPAKEKMNAWQKQTWEKVKAFQILYLKIYSRKFNRHCADWVMHCKKDIVALEDSVMTQLQRIYGDTLPEGKIRVDLTNYATWTGAFSFNNTYAHIILDAGHKSNQYVQGVEIVFHEASHFLVDNLGATLGEVVKDKKITKNMNLWHNVIFYTTAVVLQPKYDAQKRDFVPYYVVQDFEGKMPDFKLSVEAFKLYWDAYIAGKMTQKEALEKTVDYILSH